MNRKYIVFLKDRDTKTIKADSIADLIEKLKLEGIEYKDIGVVLLSCELYDYHWR